MLSSHSSRSKSENSKRRFSRGSASLPSFSFLSRKLKSKDSLRFASDFKPIDAPLQINKLRNSPKESLYKTISVDIMRRISSISKRSAGYNASSESKKKKRKNKKKNRQRNKNNTSGGDSSDTSATEIQPPALTVEEDKDSGEEKILLDQQEVYEKFKKHEEIYFPDISPNFSWCDEEPDTRQYPFSNSSFIDFNNSSLEFDVDLNLPAEPELYYETNNSEEKPGVDENSGGLCSENKYEFSSEEDSQVAFSPFESIPEDADEKENWYSVLGYIKRLLPSRKATVEQVLGPQDMTSVEELASLGVDEMYAPISLREPLKREATGLNRNGRIDVSIFEDNEEDVDQDNRIGSRACEEDISLTFETAEDAERRTVKFRNFVEKTIYSGKLPSFIQSEENLPSSQFSEKLSSTETPHEASPFTDPVINSSANSSEISIESQNDKYLVDASVKEGVSLSKISGCNSTRESIANKSILRSKTNSNYDLEKLYSIEHEMIDFQTFFDEFEYRENQRLYQNLNLETIRTRSVQKYYDKIYGHV